MAVGPSRGYESQVSPGQTAPIGGASAAAFGADVGAGMAQLGDAVHEDELRWRRLELQQQQQTEFADAAVRVERFSAEQDAAAIRDRDSAAPGAAGWTESRLTSHDQGAEEILGTIENPIVHQRIERMLEERRAQAEHDGETYEAVARGRKVANDVGELQNVAVGRVSAPGLTDAERLTVLGQVRDMGHGLLDHLTAAPEVIAATRRDFDEATANAFIRELSPPSARAALDSGRFDADLSPETRQALNGWIDAGIRRDEAEARRLQNAGQAELRAQSRVRVEQVNGGTLVEDAVLQADLARAQASTAPEDVDLAHDLNVAIVRNGTTRQYDSAPPNERTAAIREIEAHPNWQQDERLVAAHTQLVALNQRDEHRASDDMLGLYIRQTGAHVPAFDLHDPAAMNAYFAAGDAAGQRYGRPPQYIPQEQAVVLRQQWDTGTPAARAEMIQAMAFWGPRRAGAMMRQLSPVRPEHGALVSLATMRDRAAGGALVREALDGWAQPGNHPGEDARMDAAERRLLGRALTGLPGDLRAGNRRVAEGIYRHRAVQRGVTSFDEALYGESVLAAYGRVGDTGGLGHSASGAAYVVPKGMTEQDMARLVARSRPRDFAAASGGDVPLWGGDHGRALTLGEFLQLTPELVRDDNVVARYRFRSASGYVQSRAHPGGDYVVDLRELAHLTRGR